MLVYRATNHERNALAWFCWRTALDKATVIRLLTFVRAGRYRELYRRKDERKRRGGVRVQFVPIPELHEVQRAIKSLLEWYYPKHPCGFGFRGGSREDVAHKHAMENSATLKFDIRDAFWQISASRVRTVLRADRRDENAFDLCDPPNLARHTAPFSLWVQTFIEELCVCRTRDMGLARHYGKQAWKWGFLPQGAPSSPILFDMALYRIDEWLARKATNVGGVYSRYADNVFFTVPLEVNRRSLSNQLVGAVICPVLQFGFPIHKVRVVKGGVIRRVLGLNVQDTRIFSTKALRKRIKKAAHHVRACLDQGLPVDGAWRYYQGLMSALPREERESLLNIEQEVLRGIAHPFRVRRGDEQATPLDVTTEQLTPFFSWRRS